MNSIVKPMDRIVLRGAISCNNDMDWLAQRRHIHVTEFAAQSNGSIQRKAAQHKSLYLEEIIRPGTRMTRIRTDTIIDVHPIMCSILFKDSEAINNELVRTETNSGCSNFGG